MREPLCVELARRLSSSKRYVNTKTLFNNLLNNNSYPYKRYFDFFMIVLILVSVSILIYDVTSSPEPTLEFLNNILITAVFAIEYLLRLWVCSDTSKIVVRVFEEDKLLKREFRLRVALKDVAISKLRYMRTPTAIIDLLAILPFFHPLRALRLFIVFRILKLFHYTQNMHHFASILATKKFELYTLMTFVGLIVFVSSVIIYTMEARSPSGSIKTLFDAFYWSIVTISTVGYGDVAPVSAPGRVVAMVVIMTGVAVLAFATSIVVSAFTEKLDDIRDTRVLQKTKKLKNFYLVCGYGVVAKESAAQLVLLDRDILVLDQDRERLEHARSDGHMALDLNPSSVATYDILGDALMQKVKSILFLADSDIENVYAALTVGSLNIDIETISTLQEKKNRKKLLIAGVDRVIYSQELVAQLSHKHSTNPQAYKALNSLRSTDSSIIIGEISLSEDFGLDDIRNSVHSVLVVGVCVDEEFIFNPSQNYNNTNVKAVLIAHRLVIDDLQRSLV